MPRFTVEGAEKTTGRERVLSLDAADEANARAQAVAQGLLVSDIHRSAVDPTPAESVARPTPPVRAETIDYRSPANDAHHSPRLTPNYDDIITGTKVINLLARIVTFLAYLSLAVAGSAAIFAIVLLVRRIEAGRDVLIASAVFMFYALGMLIAAAILRWQGAIGLAVRDIARNSFKH